jgi:hypothetical protein
VDKTRIVRLRTGRIREHAKNSSTVILRVADLPPLPFESLFKANYAQIRELCEGYRRAGLAMIAVDRGGVQATACVAAKPEEINAAIIGRHGRTDLFLESDPSLSLRHLAVILEPLEEGTDLRFRIVDLRTPVAFLDERGRRLESLAAEGPVFVRCGGHTIFFLPTEAEPTPWPDDPEAGWQCIPERVYFDDVPAEPDRWDRRRLRARWAEVDASPSEGGRRQTVVQTSRGPAPARRRLLEEDEEPLGELFVDSPLGHTAIVIGRRTAVEGVLFGRYDRCDNEGLPAISDSRISRVHLLLLEVAGTLYAIDLGSMNGTRLHGKEVRVAPLRFGDTVELGEGLCTIRWRPLQ